MGKEYIPGGLAGRTVILANGEYPRHHLPLAVLENAARVICCDGAAEKLLSHGGSPDVVVGDLDSLPAGRHSEVKVCRVSEQDTNDLNKAFRYCLASHYESIAIIGATGLREDHTLGNISLLADFAEKVPDIIMLTDTGYFLATVTGGTFACYPGQPVSLFSFNPEQRLTTSGLKYPLNRMKLPRWWSATLNSALSTEFQLTLEDNGPVIIYFKYSD